jgi:hypothetical protein
LGGVDEPFGKCWKRGGHDDSTTKSGEEQISIQEYINFDAINEYILRQLKMKFEVCHQKWA